MVYFASDFHLGTDGRLTSRERERQIVRWLDGIAPDAEALYLVGDVFDCWFEYRKVVPKGYVRLLGKLADLREQGLPIFYFTGNHDMWMFRYLEEEMGIPIYREPVLREFGGKQFLIGHGDGLGSGDYGYKFIKTVFANRGCQWLFERLHPNLGLWMMDRFSGTSRKANPSDPKFQGEKKEQLIGYCNGYLDQAHIDFFIFGHRHLPIDYTLKNGKSRYLNLGDWIVFNSYAVFDGEQLELKFFENEQGKIFGK
ncbi:MAG: UDP-2,3-diacylglucosamine diphosphatase [Bacteroidetes bacterium]|nr:UDP-2,3-diacylglucosamine diphosphatase [Bacteroidota bacterium]